MVPQRSNLWEQFTSQVQILADHHVFLQILGARFSCALLPVNGVVLIEVISKDHDPILVDRFDVRFDMMGSNR